jgi:hypothetical protein
MEVKNWIRTFKIGWTKDMIMPWNGRNGLEGKWWGTFAPTHQRRYSTPRTFSLSGFWEGTNLPVWLSLIFIAACFAPFAVIAWVRD